MKKSELEKLIKETIEKQLLEARAPEKDAITLKLKSGVIISQEYEKPYNYFTVADSDSSWATNAVQFPVADIPKIIKFLKEIQKR